MMSLRDSSLSLSSPTLPFSLPHINYSFSMNFEIPEQQAAKPPRADSLAALVELRIRQRYALFMEPIRGYRVTMDDDYIVSPELTLQFKIPHFLLTIPSFSQLREAHVSRELSSLPIDPGLGEYLKPHIHKYAVSLAQESGMQKGFKMIFSVTVVKIELVDKQECDRIYRRGWLTLRKGKSGGD